MPGVFGAAEVAVLIGRLPGLDGAAGDRDLLRFDWCRELALDERLLGAVRMAVGAGARPVRAILFDKSAETNWTLGWHQDTKIAVEERLDAPGFTAWSEKSGVVHCQPPAAILETCVAARIHLDDNGPANGPLRVIPGSHRFGITSNLDSMTSAAAECHARAGDVLLMKPLLWHASSKSVDPTLHRRVIHIEYCGTELPHGLRWAVWDEENLGNGPNRQH